MNEMLRFVCQVRGGRVCAVDPNHPVWIPACADWLLRTGNLFRIHPSPSTEELS